MRGVSPFTCGSLPQRWVIAQARDRDDTPMIGNPPGWSARLLESPMSPDPKTVLAAANDAVSRGDHAGFLAHCTDDVVWRFIGDRTLEGKAAIRAYMDETYRQPPQFDVDWMIADGDHVVAIGRITLADADGIRTTYDYSDAWRLRDGKLAELRAFVVRADP